MHCKPRSHVGAQTTNGSKWLSFLFKSETEGKGKERNEKKIAIQGVHSKQMKRASISPCLESPRDSNKESCISEFKGQSERHRESCDLFFFTLINGGSRRVVLNSIFLNEMSLFLQCVLCVS